MKKIYVSFITLFLLAISLNSALATVGGPTIISDLRYDPISKLVFYTEQNYGGKGCPPVLKSLNPVSGQINTIYSCDYGLNKPQGYNQLNQISAYTKNFKTLEKVDMNLSDISVDVRSTGYEPNREIFEGKKFIVTISQSDMVSKQMETTICESKYPLTVDIYLIPEIPKPNTILALFSRVSSCFEGGYVNESLYPISGFSTSNMILATSWYKSQDPTLPSAFNKVVYPDTNPISELDVVPNNRPANTPTNSVIPENNVTTNQDPVVPIIKEDNITKEDNVVNTIIISLLSIIIGLLIGFAVKSGKKV